MTNSVQRILSTTILITIVSYGMYKEYAKEFFTSILKKFFNISDISNYLNYISKKQVWDNDAAGWLIYYPTYFLLHVLFIVILFSDQKKIRNWLLIALVGFIFIDLFLIVLFKELNFHQLYSISYGLFQKIIGLPFILLVIEGGRHLFKELLS